MLSLYYAACEYIFFSAVVFLLEINWCALPYGRIFHSQNFSVACPYLSRNRTRPHDILPYALLARSLILPSFRLIWTESSQKEKNVRRDENKITVGCLKKIIRNGTISCLPVVHTFNAHKFMYKWNLPFWLATNPLKQ